MIWVYINTRTTRFEWNTHFFQKQWFITVFLFQLLSPVIPKSINSSGISTSGFTVRIVAWFCKVWGVLKLFLQAFDMHLNVNRKVIFVMIMDLNYLLILGRQKYACKLPATPEVLQTRCRPYPRHKLLAPYHMNKTLLHTANTAI